MDQLQNKCFVMRCCAHALETNFTSVALFFLFFFFGGGGGHYTLFLLCEIIVIVGVGVVVLKF